MGSTYANWLQAIAIAPQNAMRKLPKNKVGEIEIDSFVTTKATTAAQNEITVQYRRGYDRMRAAQADVEQRQADHSDAEHDGELGPIANVEQDGGEVAATVGSRDQQRDGKQQRALGEAHEIYGGEVPRRRSGKGRLERQEDRGRERIQSSQTIVGLGKANCSFPGSP